MTCNRIVLLKCIATVIPKVSRYFLKTSPSLHSHEMQRLMKYTSAKETPQVSLRQILATASLSHESKFQLE